MYKLRLKRDESTDYPLQPWSIFALAALKAPVDLSLRDR
jgi:hypothetical protein